MLTTLDRVRGTASHLSKVPDWALLIFVEDASDEVESRFPGVPSSTKERLARWLAAHLATMQTPNSSQSVSSVKAADLSVTYSSRTGLQLDGSVYGQEFKRMVEELRRGASLRVM